MKIATFPAGVPSQVRALPEYAAFERHETEAILGAMGPRGAAPRVSLRWLVDQFIFADMTSLDDKGRFRLWLQLQAVVLDATAGTWSLAPLPWKELEMVRAVSAEATRAPVARRKILKALRSHDRKAEMSVGVGSFSRREVIGAQRVLRDVVNALAEAKGVQFSLGHVAAFVYPGVLSPGGAILFAPPASAVLVALAALLQKVKPFRPKRCAFCSKDGTPCVRVFLPRRRQRWCAEHKAEIRRRQEQEAQARYRRRIRRGR